MSPVAAKELAEALLGTIFMAVGFSASALSAMRVRAIDRMLLSFGFFAAIYGLRLMSHSSLIQDLVSLSRGFWDAWTCALSYVILVPMAILAEAFIGRGWRNSARFYTFIVSAAVIVCLAVDFVLSKAGAAMPLNQALVAAGMLLLAAHVLPNWRRRKGIELKFVTWTGAVFSVTALYETFATGSLFSEDFDLEPIALLLLVLSIGYYAASRMFDTERRLSVIASELVLARQIQQSILPRELPSVPGLTIAARYVPMTEVAGDFYDFYQIDGTRVAILIADVSGHGVPAALIASMVKIAVAAQTDHAHQPGRVLQSMNRVFQGILERSFITAAYAVIDSAAGTIAYSSAGHPPAILLHPDGTLDSLSAGGMMLGFLGRPYPETTTAFTPGDRLLLYTDGLIEAPKSGGNAFFGDEDLSSALASGASSSTDAFADLLLERVTAWAAPEGGSLADDVTFVVVDHTLSAAYRAPTAREGCA